MRPRLDMAENGRNLTTMILLWSIVGGAGHSIMMAPWYLKLQDKLENDKKIAKHSTVRSMFRDSNGMVRDLGHGASVQKVDDVDV